MHTLNLCELLSKDVDGNVCSTAGRVNLCADGIDDFNSFAVKAREKRFTAAAVRVAVELHMMMKHPPYETMARLVEQGVWRGID